VKCKKKEDKPVFFSEGERNGKKGSGGRELCGASNKMIKGLVLSLEGAARSTQTIWVPSTS
jgi:hypothetical protein